MASDNKGIVNGKSKWYSQFHNEIYTAAIFKYF